jgi:hypothetical protein
MAVSFSGLTPNNLPVNSRAIVDANYSVSVACPASNAKANTGNIDLGDVISGLPYATTETINIQVLTSASANGNSNTATITIQDASANSDGTANTATWANIALLGSVNVTSGASSTPSASGVFKLPPTARRFIRAQINNPSGSVSLADATLTLRLLF